MMKMKKFNKGFTLVELMVAMAISTMVLSGIYALFHKQVATHNTERMVVSMQQNIRAAVSFMERDIRMARYDPNGSGLFTIATASRAQLQFLSDNVTEDSIVNDGENITYALDNDADGNGIADGTPCNLVRIVNDAAEPTGWRTDIVARNIDALNFDYFDTAVNPANSLIDRTAAPWQVPVGQIANIRSIRLSIIGRSGENIPALFVRHRDNTVYRNRPRDTNGDSIPDTADIIFGPAAGTNVFFRRMQVTTEIDCRN
jgi:type IV pilus assembly protein PilW